MSELITGTGAAGGIGYVIATADYTTPPGWIAGGFGCFIAVMILKQILSERKQSGSAMIARDKSFDAERQRHDEAQAKVILEMTNRLRAIEDERATMLREMVHAMNRNSAAIESLVIELRNRPCGHVIQTSNTKTA